jgi:hypothetical protein
MVGMPDKVLSPIASTRRKSDIKSNLLQHTRKPKMDSRAFVLGVIIGTTLLAGCNSRNEISNPSTSTGPETLSGSVEGTLVVTSSPYLVTSDIVVDSGKTLVIQPGVELRFADSTLFTIRGRLNVEGIFSNRVRFKASETSWRGLLFHRADAASTLRFAIIENIALPIIDSATRDGAIDIRQTGIIVQNCIIRNNRAFSGGALYIDNSQCLITNNILANNTAMVFGGAVLSRRSANRFFNNTICSNQAWNFGGGVVLNSPISDEWQNNIFYDNISRSGDPRIALFETDSSQFSQEYNFPYGSTTSNPLFIDHTEFRLAPGSPCINAGNPDSTFNDPDHTRNDQGAYGGPFSPLSLVP